MTVISLNYRSEGDQTAIRQQLDRVLKSGPFQQSRRRQRFLEYIVNETLAGRGERLKGYTVALAVFDRPKTFDPALDPIVRIEAARLRDKLREYYEADGHADPIRIDLPKGSYRPQIEFLHGSNGKAESAIEAPIQATDRRRGVIAGSHLVVASLDLGSWLGGSGVASRAGRGRRMALSGSDRAGPTTNGRGACRAQRPGNCRAPLHQSERRSHTGLFQRRADRGHPHRAVAGARPSRDRAQHHLPIQGQGGRRRQARARAQRALRARRQHPAQPTTACASPRNSSTPTPEPIYGPTATIAIWRTCSSFRTRSSIRSSPRSPGATAPSSARRPSPPHARVAEQIQAYDLVLRARDAIGSDWTQRHVSPRPKTCCVRRSCSIHERTGTPRAGLVRA